MAKLLSSLNVGDIVTFGRVLNAPIRWIVIDKNHSGYPQNSVTLLAEKIIKCGFYDAKEPNAYYGRHVYGNNEYLVSNVDQWLNKDGAGGAWYTQTHTLDAPPTGAGGSNGIDFPYNGYDDDPAFLHQFTKEEKEALLSTQLFHEDATSYRKVFLLTPKELGLSVNGDYYAVKFAYFNSDDKRKTTCTAEALAENEFGSTNVDYWTRLQVSGTDSDYDYTEVYMVTRQGTLDEVRASYANAGIRPAVNLSADMKISDTVDANGAYEVLTNKPPTAPTTLTVPSQIMGGSSIVISWGAGADVDGNLSGYVLERSVNGGTWTQVYRGSLRNHTDTITYGWNTVAYRVAAYDTNSAVSSYKTGSTITVINNTAPTISGSDGALGTFSNAFTAQAYTVNDAQGGTVTVVEKLDGVTRRTYTATLGASNSFSFTTSEWRLVLNGAHTATVTATDAYGASTTRAWTFTKAMNTASFVLSPALTTTAMSTKCLVNVAGNFPDGSVLKVEVCNNGNDASPTWEDISSKLNKKHFFTNKTKTASSWAFGMRVTLTRGTATGSVWLDNINLNFE